MINCALLVFAVAAVARLFMATRVLRTQFARA